MFLYTWSVPSTDKQRKKGKEGFARYWMPQISRSGFNGLRYTIRIYYERHKDAAALPRMYFVFLFQVEKAIRKIIFWRKKKKVFIHSIGNPGQLTRSVFDGGREKRLRFLRDCDTHDAIREVGLTFPGKKPSRHFSSSMSRCALHAKKYSQNDNDVRTRRKKKVFLYESSTRES